VIAIVDYGAGNLRSVKKALDFLGMESCVTRDPEVVRRASKVVLPGVGHFAATSKLTDWGLRDAVQQAISEGTPFLGICVGMQWLFAGSEEAPATPGLGIFPGNCRRFRGNMKVPHVGWNSVNVVRDSRLFEGVEPGQFVYYTHSYHAPVEENTVGITEYDAPFAAAVEKDNIFGVQFHPEKSAALGLRLLKNFGDLKC
jgi:glutamine amidotransferase